MGRMQHPILFLLILLSFLLTLLPVRMLAAAGLIFLAVLIPFFCLSRSLNTPEGWTVTRLGLVSFRHPHLCLSPDLLYDGFSLQADLHLPAGTYPAEQLRSLPSGLLMGAALCCTSSLSPDVQTLHAVLRNAKINPERFQSQYPVLSHVSLCGQRGVVVQDGTSQRVYFLLTGLDDTTLLRFLSRVSSIADLSLREMTHADRDAILALPRDSLLLFTGSAVHTLTYLGAMQIVKRQTYHTALLDDVQALSTSGYTFFTSGSFPPPEDVIPSPSPLPVQDAQNCLLLCRQWGTLGLFDAVKEAEKSFYSFMLLFTASCTALFLLSLAVVLSALPIPSASLLLPLFCLHLFLPLCSGHVPLNSRKNRIRCLIVLVLLAADLCGTLLFHLSHPAWQLPFLIHLYCLAITLQFPCLRDNRYILFLIPGIMLIAFLLSGAQGLFAALLACLMGVVQLLVLQNMS